MFRNSAVLRRPGGEGRRTPSALALIPRARTQSGFGRYLPASQLQTFVPFAQTFALKLVPTGRDQWPCRAIQRREVGL